MSSFSLVPGSPNVVPFIDGSARRRPVLSIFTPRHDPAGPPSPKSA
jgi:hypothetical protein